MSTSRRQLLAAIFLVLPLTATLRLAEAAEGPRPSILVITVDALRADRLGSYGYSKPTSPNIDRLLASGVRFERAWTPEPLTGPAMCSMVTGLPPHVHGATRNGLRMQPGLGSLPKTLAANGWRTAAFIGTWALKDNLTLLGEHFETYGERLERRRWFGILNSEATCEDVTDDALDWLGEERKKGPEKPFFLWVHYIEPHAPYRFHEEYAERLDVNNDALTKSDRYDTEVAAVDESIGRLLKEFRQAVDDRDLIIVFTADHGESLGEHDYWGHGRHLYQPTLRIPLGIVWRGTIGAGTSSSQVTLLDLAPTLLGLADIDVPQDLTGFNMAESLRSGSELGERICCYQAHRGAVHGGHDNEKARSRGLLAVASIQGARKEIMYFHPKKGLVFDLADDPTELHNLTAADWRPSHELLACLAKISDGLGNLDRLATHKLDAESVEKLRALGYLE